MVFAARPRDPETLRLLVDAVARMVDNVLIPAEAQAEAEQAIPEPIVRQLREFGLFGMAVPESYGGLELAMGDEVQVMFEFCRASPVYRSLIGTTNGVGGKSIVLRGSDQQRSRYLPKIARGDTIVSFCLTEPEAGSDARSLRTRAERDGDEYVINGSKRFISNAPEAGLFVVMARTDPTDTSSRAISAFLVEAGTPGLEVGPPINKMGHRAAHVADVTLDNCRVPASSLLGAEEGVGFRTAMEVLDHGRVHIAAVAVGLARRFIDEALQYAQNRRQFGQAIGDFQLIQGMLADSEAEWFAAKSMVEAAATLLDAGQRITKQAASCKYFATEAMWRIADRAVQIHGGYGYVSDYPVERLFRDARLLRIYEGTSQIQQLVIAREMLKGN
ncbi:MAG: acyl-CoA dehydrogenase family protein [Pseudomonadota bacterium]